METSLRNAALFRAGVVLLVPAVVDPKTSYADAWKRSQKVIRERMLPLADRAQGRRRRSRRSGTSSSSRRSSSARYVDEFQSPWVKAYFDVGNVALLRLPAGLDPHARQAHRPGAPEGLHGQAAARAGSTGRTSARATSTGRGAEGVRRDRLRRLHDDRDRRRRQGVPHRRLEAVRPVPGGPAADGGLAASHADAGLAKAGRGRSGRGDRSAPARRRPS